MSPQLGALLRRSARCRCPRCGKGAVFAGFLTLNQACADCGLPIASLDSGDGPAVFLIFILGFLCVPSALVFALHVDWPLWADVLLWGSIIILITLLAIRPAKALTLALQYRHKPETFE